MDAVERPAWWSYPLQCRNNHVWRPGTVTVSWLPCLCAGGTGHLMVSCRTDGCDSPAWHRPRHREGAEIGSRPGGPIEQY
jgi:hypothetical protein